jgi:TonB family protein
VVLNTGALAADLNAIALIVILSTLAGSVTSVASELTDLAPTIPALPAKEASNIGRFEIRDGTHDPSWLDDRFREALWRNDAKLRELNNQSPRLLEEYLRSKDFSTVKQALALSGSWKSGNAMHTWVFDAPDQPGGLIVRALELEDLSDPSGYYVRATVHCYDTEAFCKAYRNRQMLLMAPKPAEASNYLAQLQWRNRVKTESCTVFSRNMRQPQYPASALRDGIEGSVMVGILFNSCGNVRDAWIQQSSGSRELDRAALTQAFKWQIDLQSLPKDQLDSRQATVPIRFLLGDEPAMD